MRPPDARTRHAPDPAYLRRLVDATGLTQRQLAKRLGISSRLLRYYLLDLDHASHRPMPYPEQYALEALAAPPFRLQLLHEPPPITIGA